MMAEVWRRSTHGLLTVSVVFALQVVDPAKAADRPNVLVIVADDLAGRLAGVGGEPHAKTPNIDRLAEQGVWFSRAYCNSPVCTPSRQSFLTGKLPHEIGVTQLKTALKPDVSTLAKRLAAAGYDTAAIGKMHFNSQHQHGFQHR